MTARAHSSHAEPLSAAAASRTSALRPPSVNATWAAGGNRAVAAILGSLHSFHGLQRKCAECEQEEEKTPASTEPDQAQSNEESPGTAPASTLVVDDEAADVRPEQMRKTEFLAQLRETVCATANEGMAQTGQTADACPWLDYWFDTAAGKDAAYVEKGIRKFAPETAGASTAREMMPIAAARVRLSVDHWAKTGEIGDLPEGITPELPGAGLLGSMAGLLFKARPGGARNATDPETIRAELGSGHPLSGNTRSRMETAFGLGFGRVRLHTDRHAASVSDRLNARAFTVGEHVAFGHGEYQPGTMMGDALIAHELAHVVQQGAARAAAPQSKGRNTGASALEQDADHAALGVVSQLWGDGRQQQTAPQQRSGLRLSRCSKPTPKPTLPSQPTQADQKNMCKGSPIRIEVRKPADLSGTFTKSAIKSAEGASSGVSFLVPLNATSLTVNEEAECLLTWSCGDGKSGVERETWTHQWSADPPEIAVDGQQRTVSDSHSYGMAHRPGSQVRERAEKNGFDMDTCSWEFSENFKGTPVLKAGDKELHRCVFGNRFEATQKTTGKEKPQRSASVTYWGVDQEEVLKGFP